MKHRSLTNDPPAIKDPVVVAGMKYRIVSIEVDGIHVYLRTSFGGHELTVDRHDLYWDPLPCVWRAG